MLRLFLRKLLSQEGANNWTNWKNNYFYLSAKKIRNHIRYLDTGYLFPHFYTISNQSLFSRLDINKYFCVSDTCVTKYCELLNKSATLRRQRMETETFYNIFIGNPFCFRRWGRRRGQSHKLFCSIKIRQAIDRNVGLCKSRTSLFILKIKWSCLLK